MESCIEMGCDDFGFPGLLSWNCANCFTINPSECTILQAQLTYGGQFLPNPLPVGYADSAYSHDIAFKLKKDTTITMPAFGTLTIPFDSCKILSIGNLPLDSIWLLAMIRSVLIIHLQIQ
ncbi:MAG: hypothetical protein IPI77_15400 [Saprospiraceae bacterium]|nr:hypothetical protein [Saprospiraceae bacterium]